MKRHLLVLAIVTASSLAFSQESALERIAGYRAVDRAPSAVSFEKAVQNLVVCLSNGNEGVVRSALSHVVRIRVVNPQLSLAKAESVVKDLIVDGMSPAIRYEAFLSNAVMENPGLVNYTDCDPDSPPESLFSTIATRLRDANFGPLAHNFTTIKH